MQRNRRYKLIEGATPRAAQPSEAQVFLQPKTEVEDELVFNVERDVAPYFEEMKKKMHDYFQSGDLDNFLALGRLMVSLFSQQRSDLNLTDAIFSAVKDKIISQFQQPRSFIFACLNLECACQMFPDRQTDLNSAAYFQQIKAEMDDFYSQNSLESYCQRAEELCVIYPERRGDLDLKADAFQFIQEQSRNFRDSEDWFEFCSWINQACIIFPNRRMELDVTPWDIQQINRTMDVYRRRQDWIDFGTLAQALMLMTEKPKPLTQPASPLPNRLTK